MADLAALKAELLKPAYTGMSDSAAGSALVTRAAVYVDIAWSDIRDVLMASDDWARLAYTSMLTSGSYIGRPAPASPVVAGAAYSLTTRVQAIYIRECCLYGGMLRTSNDTIRTTVSAIATALRADSIGALSVASVTEIGAAIQRQRSPAETIGWAILHDMDAASLTAAVARARAS